MSKPRIGFLSQSELDAIHNASLKILERTGIKVMSTQALDVLKKAGAKVDCASNHASIPRNLVQEALGMVPKTITYAARNPKHDFTLNKQEPHFCADGSAPFIIDSETGERRYSTSDDIARCATIADYLDHVHVVWRMATAMDVPQSMQNIVGMYTCLSNTEKHFEGGISSGKEAQYAIEIAAAIVGGKEELRKRPIISAIECPFSPLTYDKGVMEASIELAKAGVPVVIYTMPRVGATGPATLPGTMVMNNAEFLGGLVIQEFASPGAPVVYAIDVSTMDFKTGSSCGSPERNLMDVGLAQLAYRYGLPTEKESSWGSSRILDAQAGYSKAISLITCMLTAPDIILGLGGLADGTCPEAMVFDNGIMDYALGFTRGFEVNDGALAVDLINKVGPGGNFLGEKHTLDHFRERWIPRFSVDSLETWQRKGSKSIAKVAKEQTEEILATHKPEPIPEDIERQISEILKRAEAEGEELLT